MIPSIGIDMKCVNPSMTFGEVCHSFWCRPTMSQAEWALLAMLGKHQEVFDFVQEVLLTDGFSLTSIYNSDVRHPVDGYFCRCTYTSLMATFCTFTSNHPFQGSCLLPDHGSWIHSRYNLIKRLARSWPKARDALLAKKEVRQSSVCNSYHHNHHNPNHQDDHIITNVTSQVVSEMVMVELEEALHQFPSWEENRWKL